MIWTDEAVSIFAEILKGALQRVIAQGKEWAAEEERKRIAAEKARLAKLKADADELERKRIAEERAWQARRERRKRFLKGLRKVSIVMLVAAVVLLSGSYAWNALQRHMRLPLKPIYQSIMTTPTAAEYSSLLAQLEPAVAEIERMPRSSQAALRIALQELFRGLSERDSNILLGSARDELAKNYLFETDPSTYVSGGSPLSKALEGAGVARFIERFSQAPVYEQELYTILALVKVRLLRYEVIQAYKRIQARPTNGLSEVERLLRRAEALMPPNRSYLGGTRGYVRSQRNELKKLQRMVRQKAATSDTRRIDSWLSKMLLRHCNAGQTERKRNGLPMQGDCQGVE